MTRHDVRCSILAKKNRVANGSRSVAGSILGWLDRYYTTPEGVTRTRDVRIDPAVRIEGPVAVGRGTKLVGECSIGRGTTIGEYAVLNGPMSVGRFCQLGAHVGIFGSTHPTDGMSTYVGGLLGPVSAGVRLQEPVSIGSDVWIGHGAVILPGVSVGNSAVVGANAVVTSDVEPYSVCVGVPARTIRKRIHSEAQEYLDRVRWWDWPVGEVAERMQILLNSNPIHEGMLEWPASQRGRTKNS